jgi:hypothetical protein
MIVCVVSPLGVHIIVNEYKYHDQARLNRLLIMHGIFILPVSPHLGNSNVVVISETSRR